MFQRFKKKLQIEDTETVVAPVVTVDAPVTSSVKYRKYHTDDGVEYYYDGEQSTWVRPTTYHTDEDSEYERPPTPRIGDQGEYLWDSTSSSGSEPDTEELNRRLQQHSASDEESEPDYDLDWKIQSTVEENPFKKLIDTMKQMRAIYTIQRFWRKLLQRRAERQHKHYQQGPFGILHKWTARPVVILAGVKMERLTNLVLKYSKDAASLEFQAKVYVGVVLARDNDAIRPLPHGQRIASVTQRKRAGKRLYARCHGAAAMIQALFHGYLVRRRVIQDIYYMMTHGVIVIPPGTSLPQVVYVRRLPEDKVRESAEQVKAAACKMQAVIRGWLCRKTLLNEVETVLGTHRPLKYDKIELDYRYSHLWIRRLVKHADASTHAFALKIQRYYRGFACRRHMQRGLRRAVLGRPEDLRPPTLAQEFQKLRRHGATKEKFKSAPTWLAKRRDGWRQQVVRVLDAAQNKWNDGIAKIQKKTKLNPRNMDIIESVKRKQIQVKDEARIRDLFDEIKTSLRTEIAEESVEKEKYKTEEMQRRALEDAKMAEIEENKAEVSRKERIERNRRRKMAEDELQQLIAQEEANKWEEQRIRLLNMYMDKTVRMSRDFIQTRRIEDDLKVRCKFKGILSAEEIEARLTVEERQKRDINNRIKDIAKRYGVEPHKEDAVLRCMEQEIKKAPEWLRPRKLEKMGDMLKILRSRVVKLDHAARLVQMWYFKSLFLKLTRMHFCALLIQKTWRMYSERSKLSKRLEKAHSLGDAKMRSGPNWLQQRRQHVMSQSNQVYLQTSKLKLGEHNENILKKSETVNMLKLLGRMNRIAARAWLGRYFHKVRELTKASVKIQSVWRGFTVRKNLKIHAKRKAKLSDSLAVHKKLLWADRRFHQQLETELRVAGLLTVYENICARQIQRVYRCYLARKLTYLNYQRRYHSAVLVQRMFRLLKARRSMVSKTTARHRAALLHKSTISSLTHSLPEIRRTAGEAQRQFSSFCQLIFPVAYEKELNLRAKLENCRKRHELGDVVVEESQVRKPIVKKVIPKYSRRQERNAAIQIQAAIRGWLTRSHFVEEYAFLDLAALLIQVEWRLYMLRRADHDHYPLDTSDTDPPLPSSTSLYSEEIVILTRISDSTRRHFWARRLRRSFDVQKYSKFASLRCGTVDSDATVSNIKRNIAISTFDCPRSLDLPKDFNVRWQNAAAGYVQTRWRGGRLRLSEPEDVMWSPQGVEIERRRIWYDNEFRALRFRLALSIYRRGGSDAVTGIENRFHVTPIVPQHYSEMFQHDRATIIQAAWRGYVTRRELSRRFEFLNWTAIMIQSAYRAHVTCTRCLKRLARFLYGMEGGSKVANDLFGDAIDEDGIPDPGHLTASVFDPGYRGIEGGMRGENNVYGGVFDLAARKARWMKEQRDLLSNRSTWTEARRRVQKYKVDIILRKLRCYTTKAIDLTSIYSLDLIPKKLYKPPAFLVDIGNGVMVTVKKTKKVTISSVAGGQGKRDSPSGQLKSLVEQGDQWLRKHLRGDIETCNLETFYLNKRNIDKQRYKQLIEARCHRVESLPEWVRRRQQQRGKEVFERETAEFLSGGDNGKTFIGTSMLNVRNKLQQKELVQSRLRNLIKLQSLWRGYRARKKFYKILEKALIPSKRRPDTFVPDWLKRREKHLLDIALSRKKRLDQRTKDEQMWRARAERRAARRLGLEVPAHVLERANWESEFERNRRRNKEMIEEMERLKLLEETVLQKKILREKVANIRDSFRPPLLGEEAERLQSKKDRGIQLELKRRDEEEKIFDLWKKTVYDKKEQGSEIIQAALVRREEQQAAAVKLQAAFRGKLVRKQIVIRMRKYKEVASTMQAYKNVHWGREGGPFWLRERRFRVRGNVISKVANRIIAMYRPNFQVRTVLDAYVYKMDKGEQSLRDVKNKWYATDRKMEEERLAREALEEEQRAKEAEELRKKKEEEEAILRKKGFFGDKDKTDGDVAGAEGASKGDEGGVYDDSESDSDSVSTVEEHGMSLIEKKYLTKYDIDNLPEGVTPRMLAAVIFIQSRWRGFVLRRRAWLRSRILLRLESKGKAVIGPEWLKRRRRAWMDAAEQMARNDPSVLESSRPSIPGDPSRRVHELAKRTLTEVEQLLEDDRAIALYETERRKLEMAEKQKVDDKLFGIPTRGRVDESVKTVTEDIGIGHQKRGSTFIAQIPRHKLLELRVNLRHQMEVEENRAATLIQALWRGCRVRIHLLDMISAGELNWGVLRNLVGPGVLALTSKKREERRARDRHSEAEAAKDPWATNTIFSRRELEKVRNRQAFPGKSVEGDVGSYVKHTRFLKLRTELIVAPLSKDISGRLIDNAILRRWGSVPLDNLYLPSREPRRLLNLGLFANYAAKSIHPSRFLRAALTIQAWWRGSITRRIVIQMKYILQTRQQVLQRKLALHQRATGSKIAVPLDNVMNEFEENDRQLRTSKWRKKWAAEEKRLLNVVKKEKIAAKEAMIALIRQRLGVRDTDVVSERVLKRVDAQQKFIEEKTSYAVKIQSVWRGYMARVRTGLKIFRKMYLGPRAKTNMATYKLSNQRGRLLVIFLTQRDRVYQRKLLKAVLLLQRMIRGWLGRLHFKRGIAKGMHFVDIKGPVAIDIGDGVKLYTRGSKDSYIWGIRAGKYIVIKDKHHCARAIQTAWRRYVHRFTDLDAALCNEEAAWRRVTGQEVMESGRDRFIAIRRVRAMRMGVNRELFRTIQASKVIMSRPGRKRVWRWRSKKYDEGTWIWADYDWRVVCGLAEDSKSLGPEVGVSNEQVLAEPGKYREVMKYIQLRLEKLAAMKMRLHDLEHNRAAVVLQSALQRWLSRVRFRKFKSEVSRPGMKWESLPLEQKRHLLRKRHIIAMCDRLHSTLSLQHRQRLSKTKIKGIPRREKEGWYDRQHREQEEQSRDILNRWQTDPQMLDRMEDLDLQYEIDETKRAISESKVKEKRQEVLDEKHQILRWQRRVEIAIQKNERRPMEDDREMYEQMILDKAVVDEERQRNDDMEAWIHTVKEKAIKQREDPLYEHHPSKMRRLKHDDSLPQLLDFTLERCSQRGLSKSWRNVEGLKKKMEHDEEIKRQEQDQLLNERRRREMPQRRSYRKDSSVADMPTTSRSGKSSLVLRPVHSRVREMEQRVNQSTAKLRDISARLRSTLEEDVALKTKDFLTENRLLINSSAFGVPRWEPEPVPVEVKKGDDDDSHEKDSVISFSDYRRLSKLGESIELEEQVAQSLEALHAKSKPGYAVRIEDSDYFDMRKRMIERRKIADYERLKREQERENDVRIIADMMGAAYMNQIQFAERQGDTNFDTDDGGNTEPQPTYPPKVDKEDIADHDDFYPEDGYMERHYEDNLNQWYGDNDKEGVIVEEHQMEIEALPLKKSKVEFNLKHDDGNNVVDGSKGMDRRKKERGSSSHSRLVTVLDPQRLSGAV